MVIPDQFCYIIFETPGTLSGVKKYSSNNNNDNNNNNRNIYKVWNNSNQNSKTHTDFTRW